MEMKTWEELSLAALKGISSRLWWLDSWLARLGQATALIQNVFIMDYCVKYVHDFRYNDCGFGSQVSTVLSFANKRLYDFAELCQPWFLVA